MAATEHTYQLQLDLRESTEFQRAHSVLSIAPNIVTEEPNVVTDILDSGDPEIIIPLGGLTEAQFVVMMLDDQLDGTVKVKLNGSAVAIPCEKVMVWFGTTITEIILYNDSGNRARVRIWLG